MPFCNVTDYIAAVEMGGKIYAIGGDIYITAGLRHMDVFDPATNKWTLLPEMSTARGE